METFTNAKELVINSSYQSQRKIQLEGLSDRMIDAPIVEVIHTFNQLPFCFTLQSCYGHFLYGNQRNLHHIEPLPDTNLIDRVEYRIAYIAFCAENSNSGKMLIETLKEITEIAPENIQFCCADWFWKRQVNSYALQVEPDRFKHMDIAMLDYDEALKVEKIRDLFFAKLQETLNSKFHNWL
jgi:hypothetical protein